MKYSNIIDEVLSQVLHEKKAKKDYDGDGKIESSEEEYKGSRDKAIKKNMKESHHELSDDESSMAQSQLISIISNSTALMQMIKSGDQLDAWVQSKLTKAEDYLDSVKGYIEGESRMDAIDTMMEPEMAVDISEQEEGGEEIKVGNYQTKHFHMCPAAIAVYKDIEVEDMDLAERTAKLHDALFAIEENALKSGASDYDVEAAQIIADQIMEMSKMMGLEKEHGYVQGHVDKIKGAIGGSEYEEELDEKLGKGASMEDYIDDFLGSDAPQFKGKSKDEIIKMANAAYYEANPSKGKK